VTAEGTEVVTGCFYEITHVARTVRVVGERPRLSLLPASFARRVTLRRAGNFKGSQAKAYLDCTVHFSESKLRKTAHAASEAVLIKGIDMAEMDNRGARQAGFLWRHLDCHRKSSHLEVTRDSRHDGQLACSVSNVILDNQCWMRTSHLTGASDREINEIDFASSWGVHLTPPPFGLTR